MSCGLDDTAGLAATSQPPSPVHVSATPGVCMRGTRLPAVEQRPHLPVPESGRLAVATVSAAVGQRGASTTREGVRPPSFTRWPAFEVTPLAPMGGAAATEEESCRHGAAAPPGACDSPVDASRLMCRQFGRHSLGNPGLWASVLLPKPQRRNDQGSFLLGARWPVLEVTPLVLLVGSGRGSALPAVGA